MRPAAALSAYALVLVLVFAAALAVGNAVGLVGPASGGTASHTGDQGSTSLNGH